MQTINVFCCVRFSSFGAHSPHASLILFCVADLYTHTLGASTVPSPSCEAPPEQGHKVLEAGTRYPYNENCEIIQYNLF